MNFLRFGFKRFLLQSDSNADFHVRLNFHKNPAQNPQQLYPFENNGNGNEYGHNDLEGISIFTQLANQISLFRASANSRQEWNYLFEIPYQHIYRYKAGEVKLPTRKITKIQEINGTKGLEQR